MTYCENPGRKVDIKKEELRYSESLAQPSLHSLLGDIDAIQTSLRQSSHWLADPTLADDLTTSRDVIIINIGASPPALCVRLVRPNTDKYLSTNPRTITPY